MSELNRCVSLRLLRLPFEPVLFALWIALFPATPKPPEPSVVTWHCRATARMLAVNLAPYLAVGVQQRKVILSCGFPTLGSIAIPLPSKIEIRRNKVAETELPNPCRCSTPAILDASTNLLPVFGNRTSRRTTSPKTGWPFSSPSFEVTSVIAKDNLGPSFS